jgi:hypothetical protein
LFPANCGGAIAGVATLEPDEVGTTPAMSFSIRAISGGDSLLMGSMIISAIRPPAPEGIPTRFPFVVPFTIPVTGPATMSVGLDHDGKTIGEVRFAVLGPVPDNVPDR